eukprot:10637002-Alexandrium_andersonii.AAC.1
MSASLVGSEMCIRDSFLQAEAAVSRGPSARCPSAAAAPGHQLRRSVGWGPSRRRPGVLARRLPFG